LALMEHVRQLELPQILTSYVDLSMPRATRQSELFDRYRFDCACPLCEMSSREPSQVDPRQALKCKVPKCDGLAAFPGRSGSVPMPPLIR
jgi:hypothetical protein